MYVADKSSPPYWRETLQTEVASLALIESLALDQTNAAESEDGNAKQARSQSAIPRNHGPVSDHTGSNPVQTFL